MPSNEGLCKVKNIPKIRDDYGSGFQAVPGLTRKQNCKIVKLGLYYFGVVYCVYFVSIYIIKSC